MQEINRRATPKCDASPTFKRHTGTPIRPGNSSKLGLNTITVIKAAPTTFPKSKSEHSLASVSSGSESGDRPVSGLTTGSNATREVSIQTGDTTDDNFMKDAVICHPSPSVLEQLRDNLHGLKLNQVGGQRRRRKLSLGQATRREKAIKEDDDDEESLMLGVDSSHVNHELRRTSHLERLQEFLDTNSVREKDEELAMSEHEELLLKNIRKLAAERKQRFIQERELREQV